MHALVRNLERRPEVALGNKRPQRENDDSFSLKGFSKCGLSGSLSLVSHYGLWHLCSQASDFIDMGRAIFSRQSS